MSYTQIVKEEILSKKSVNISQKFFELYSILKARNFLKQNELKIRTENSGLAKRVYSIIKEISNLDLIVKYSIARKFSGYKIYTISAPNQKQFAKLLKFFIYIDNLETITLEKNIIGFLRGIFLISGYLKAPEKEYALDFFIDNKKMAEFLYKILKKLGKKIFLTEKNGKYIVYIRNHEDIVDILALLGANTAYFRYQEIIILKSVKNKTVRSINWEVANEIKSIAASDKQINIINTIENLTGLDSLSVILQKTAISRLENPDLTLKELAEKLGVSKSGLRGRLKRIENIYIELTRGDNGN